MSKLYIPTSSPLRGTPSINEADAKVISKRKGYPLQPPLAPPHTGGRADYQAVSPPVQEGLGGVVR